VPALASRAATLTAAGSAPLATAGPPLTVVAFVQRDRIRTLVRSAFPRRRAHVVVTRTLKDFDAATHAHLVDAVLVDVGGQHEDTWRVAARARELPTAPFFGLLALRAAEGPVLAQCASCEFADILIDAVDEPAARELVARSGFTARFARALDEPPPVLELESTLQRGAWNFLVAHAGRPVRTPALAQALRVTREHLSRSFAADGGANLKRIIDLVRVIAAAELAKNPGYDIRDVARVLEFASPSHLGNTAMRIVGTKPSSLSRLRTIDLVERFSRGHGRSRGKVTRATR
jgi:AraC-like DNA-binding protein